MHAGKDGFGAQGARGLGAIESGNFPTVLDYGCGKGQLKRLVSHRGLPVTVYNYDPGLDVDERRPCALVVCLDVLEHIEPEYLDAVLADICANTRGYLRATISTKKANKTLPNGKNAHRIVRDERWWREQLIRYFLITHEYWKRDQYHVWAEPRD